MNMITQSFAGHLGGVELAAISISNTVIVGFNYGLLVRYYLIFIFYLQN
jgi:MATE family multidrug resistance protein